MPELNKYLKHHRLEKHLNSTKTDKVQVITRRWLLRMNPEVTDLLQTGLRERDEAENEPLLDSDNDDSDEDDNGGSKSSADEENENDYIDSGDRDELRVVILAFISDEEEVKRPAITHSGRTNNKNCHQHAVCSNNISLLTCHCLSGYAGDNQKIRN